MSDERGVVRDAVVRCKDGDRSPRHHRAETGCPTLTWVTFCPFGGLRDGMNTRVAGDQTLGPNWERQLSPPSSLYGSASTAGVPWSPPLSDSPSIETKTMA